MRENIKWLIDQYSDIVDELQRERHDNHTGIGMTVAYITAKIGVYGKVVADLQQLLDESEEAE